MNELLHDLTVDLVDTVKPPFRIEDLPSVWSLPAQTDWLVDDLIPGGAITLLTGDSGVGKSTLALALAGAVAHGTPFLGFLTRQKRVVYVDGEDPLSAVRERLERFAIEESPNLHIWGGWNDPTPVGPKHSSLLTFAREHHGFIVFDSLIDFHSGSEQDSSETRKYLRLYRALANAGAAVLVLHHTGKGENSKQYRGSSDIKAAVDQAYCLESVGDGEGETRSLRLTPFKTRIALVNPVRLEWTPSGIRVAAGSVRTSREIVLDIIGSNPRLNGTEIMNLARAAGVAKNRCEQILKEGVRDGWIIAIPGPRNSTLYELPGPRL